jgi:iron complex transport system substrate-binding protein
MKKLALLLAALPLMATPPPSGLSRLAAMSRNCLGAGGGAADGRARQHQHLACEAQKLPDVGYVRQLNAEGILSLRPTLVLASAQAQPSLVLKKVEENNVKAGQRSGRL